MEYTITLQKVIDLEQVKQSMNDNPEITNVLYKVLGPYETSFVQAVVNQTIEQLEKQVEDAENETLPAEETEK